MSQSFYQYMMRFRSNQVKDEFSLFAEAMYHDHDFPKNSHDYHVISNYLELTSSYITSMSLFDEAWDLYLSSR